MAPRFPSSCLRTYHPERPLAAGGYGTVWLATHIALNRRVALKILHTHPGDPDDPAGRFRDEARISAILTHPSIVKVLDHGVDEDDPWIAYEYIEGPALGDLLDRGPLPVADAVEATRQVAEALSEAHAHGVIHRDLKPDNVLQGPDGTYKLTDFGIAKWAHATAEATAPEVVLGSPAYIAPERIKGESPTASSDIYALGVMLFETLTGRLPFEDESATAIFAHHCATVPPRVASLRPEVPAHVDALVAQMLEKLPAARPKDAAEVAQRLAAGADDDDMPTIPLSPRARRPKPASSAAKPAPSAAKPRSTAPRQRPPGWRTQAWRRAVSPVGLALGWLAALVLILGLPELRPRAVRPDASPSPAASVMIAELQAQPALEAMIGRLAAAMDHSERAKVKGATLDVSATSVPTKNVSGTTRAPLDPARREEYQGLIPELEADLVTCEKAAAFGASLLRARAGGWTGAGLRSRALARALLVQLQLRHLQRELEGSTPGGTTATAALDAKSAERLTDWLTPLPQDLARVLELDPRGEELGRLLGDVLYGSRILYRHQPFPPVAAGAIKTFRGRLSLLPGPHGALVGAVARGFWEYGKSRDPLDPPFDRIWGDVATLRAAAPGLPGDLLLPEIMDVVAQLSEHENKYDHDLEHARRRWMVDDNRQLSLSSRVKDELEIAATLERALEKLPPGPPETLTRLLTVRMRLLGVHLRLYTLIDRLTAVTALGHSVHRLSERIWSEAADLMDRSHALKPTRVPLLKRYLDAFGERIEAIAAGGPPIQLFEMMMDLISLARRARWPEMNAGDPARVAIQAWHERRRGLTGPRGAAIAGLVSAFWDLGTRRLAAPARDALVTHIPTLRATGPDPDDDTGRLLRLAPSMLDYGRPAASRPSREPPKR